MFKIKMVFCIFIVKNLEIKIFILGYRVFGLVEFKFLIYVFSFLCFSKFKMEVICVN